MEYIDPLKRRMREQVLLAMVQPYQRVTVAFLAKELNLTAIDVIYFNVHQVCDYDTALLYHCTKSTWQQPVSVLVFVFTVRDTCSLSAYYCTTAVTTGAAAD
eukprot:14695-Heterococcus_DN1.PRE.2